MNSMASCKLVVCLHDRDGNSNYAKALAAQYVSIRQRTHHPLHYFVVYDQTVNKVDLSNLAALIERRDAFEAIPIEEFPIIEEICRLNSTRFSPAAMWRIFLTDILREDRCLSLDADIIPLCDIAPLFEAKLQGKSLSAPLRRVALDATYLNSINCRARDYFRTGLCLMDLSRLRNNATFRREREPFIRTQLANINRIKCLPDQSAPSMTSLER